VVVSLHQVNVALKYCPRTVALHAGRVVYDGPSANLTPALLRELYGAEADEILELCRAAVAKVPARGELQAAHARLLADWHSATDSAAGAARHLAVELLLQPPGAAQFAPPPELQWDGLPTKLQQLLDGNPVVVEGRNL